MNVRIYIGIITFFICYNLFADFNTKILTNLEELKEGLNESRLLDPDKNEEKLILDVASSTHRALVSWILLLDSNHNNPYFSKVIYELRENNKSCAMRIGLELLNNQLKKINSSIYKAQVLNKVFSKNNPNGIRSNFEIERWAGINDSSFEFFLLGTRSYKKNLSDELINFHQFYYNLWLNRSEEKINQLDLDYTCPENMSKVDLFPWIDYTLIKSMQTVQIDQNLFRNNLNNLVETTALIPIINYDKYNIIPNYSFALRPMFGLVSPSPHFKKSFFELVNQLAFNSEGFMNVENCKTVDNVARFGSMIGLEFQYYEDKKNGLLEIDLFKESLKTYISLIIMRDSTDRYIRNNCANAAHSFEQLWGYQIDIGHIDNLQINGHIRSSKKELTVNFQSILENWQFGIKLKKMNRKKNNVKKPIDSIDVLNKK